MKLFFFFRINAFPHHHLSFSFPVLHFKCIASMLRQAGVYEAKFFHGVRLSPCAGIMKEHRSRLLRSIL